jgi:hypothetical protein
MLDRGAEVPLDRPAVPEEQPGADTRTRTAAAVARPPPSGRVSYFFLLFLLFLFFLLFLATYITPLHDPVGQRSVDQVSTYH